jgi:hypothetical protein
MNIDYVYEEQGYGIIFYIEIGDGNVVIAGADSDLDDGDDGGVTVFQKMSFLMIRRRIPIPMREVWVKQTLQIII